VTAPQFTGTVDLQAHSTASDGAVAPGDIAAVAVAANVVAFALTDHDSVSGVAAATAAGDRLHVRVVPGVELSAMQGEQELHMLGLHVEALGTLETKLGEFRAQREQRAETIVAKLQALGLPIAYSDVAREAGGGAFGRPHVARALIAAGACQDFREAFDRYLGAGRPAYVAKPKLSVRDAIAIVHDAGGLAVWAHPAGAGRRDALESLVADGLDGVEVRHPSHSNEDAARILALCEHFELVPSGGSDWHGEATGRRTLGGMQVPFEWLEIQDARVAVRRAAGVS
jgi:hypothetical protein